MREYSTPMTIAAPLVGNLTDDVVRNRHEAPTAPVLTRRTGRGEPWTDVDATEFAEQVGAVARGLIAAGIAPGDRVGLISRTRWEWTVLDYAVWFAGAVSVPVYESASAEQIAWILGDSGARAVLVETHLHLERLAEVRDRLDALELVWCLADGALADLEQGAGAVSPTELEQRRTSAGPSDLATLVYTSGTTGRPKGCALTHGNLMLELDVTLAELAPLFGPAPESTEGTGDAEAEGGDTGSSTLLFLPLAHVFARIVQIGAIRSRTRLGHSSDITSLVEDLAEFRPTFLLAVPRVFEKLFNTASQRATADGRGRVFERAAGVAIAWSRAQDRGRVSLKLRAEHALGQRLVYAALREALGGRCAYAVCGGAPLGERLGHFYRGIGLTVLEGYGLTESAGALCVNVPDGIRIGTVGRPLPGTSVRVADDGELLFRGGQVFDGYWHDEPATAAALTTDGWLHTGDVGEVDDEGFVRVTGRRREILVTAGGKNVAPAVLEDALRAHPLVDQCMVVGDGRPFIAALVTVDADAFPAWAAAHGRSGPPSDHVEDPDLVAEIQLAVDQANRAVSRAESIRRFAILPEAWTEEGGQLTPSLKLRRTIVRREHRDDIDALYRS